MKKYILLTLLIICHIMTLVAANHSGSITTSVIWYVRDSPHNITGTLTVSNNATITIEDACVVNMEADFIIASDGALAIEENVTFLIGDDYRFEIEGEFIAIGTAAQPIYFYEETSGDTWGGINFFYGSENNEMKYCIVTDCGKSYTSGYSYDDTYCGGAIYVENGPDLLIENCTFYENEASCGAAIFGDVASSDVIIRKCEFYDNYAYDGAGIGLVGGNCIIKLCKFYENNPENNGGAIYMDDGAYPDIINNLIYNNAAIYGGGIYIIGTSDPNIFNCTISDNQATVHGGGVYYDATSTPVFLNTIIFWNTGSPYNQCYPDPDNNSGHYSHCDIDEINFSSNGNISADPKFVDKDNYDYRISGLNSTPCENTGDRNSNAYTINDLKGDPRITASTYIDIGAYEYESGASYRLIDDNISKSQDANIIFSYYINHSNYLTSFHFQLPEGGNICVNLTDLSSKTHTQIIDTNFPTGNTSYVWHENKLSQGIYFITIIYNGKIRGCEKILIN
jgi:parallel beta-helix repeat protein